MGYERNWRGQRYSDREQSQRYRRDPDYDQDERGFIDRAGDEVRSWFGDEEAERRRRLDDMDYVRRHRDDSGYGDYDRGASGSYAPYTGGTYRESSQRYTNDPRYHEWRSREIAALDRDYHDYRRENQSRFDEEFGSWRQTRMQQRNSLRQVQEQQEVVGSDGQHLGTVDHVRSDRIILSKGDKDAGGHHHSIPCSWVKMVTDRVELNCTADYARQAWKDEEHRGALFGNEA